MESDLEGGLSGEGLRIALVVSRFNDLITSQLVRGAREALRRHGVSDADVTVARVPGSFELPLIAKRLAESGTFEAVIAIGTVIRGETPHFEYVAGQAAAGLLRAGLDTGVPVIFAVTTAETQEQALARAGAHGGNRGYEAGVAAIEMANVCRAIDSRLGEKRCRPTGGSSASPS